MSVVAVIGAPRVALAIKAVVLSLACALAPQAGSAHPIGESVYFQVARVPSADAPIGLGLDIGNEAREVSSFAAFMPMPDADSLRARIAALEEDGDSWSPQFAELNEQLGHVLQAEGEHDAALAAFDRSFQANRRFEGLHSPAQTALMRAQIDSHRALGDADMVDQLQDSLFAMQLDLLADRPAELADAYRDAADWNVQYYLETEPVAAGSMTDAHRRERSDRLATALGQYHRALWLLTSNAPDALHADKAMLERRIAALTLIADRQYQHQVPSSVTKPNLASLRQSKHMHNPTLFAHGSAALQRAAAYGADGAEPPQRAMRQLELADWYLLMDRHEQAREAYRAALATLRAANLPEAEIVDFVESGFPVHDPERELRSLALAPDAGFDGYIDVSFDVDRFGKAHNPRVLASADDVAYDDWLEYELLREIRSGRFRPGFADDVPVARDDVTLRYYFAR
ncbi:MAG: hypothetical protein SV422_09310 [Pseudomonadota bacterium]|nr:hypothetical protein [Pseudomonadota bacterium]